jgi:hypothetical protein
MIRPGVATITWTGEREGKERGEGDGWRRGREREKERGREREREYSLCLSNTTWYIHIMFGA